VTGIVRATRLHPGRLFSVLSTGLCVGLSIGFLGACVDNFNGSKIELYLHGGVQVPGDNPAGNGRPPSDTHYEIWIGKDQSAFHIADFDIRPAIDTGDPCFIEEEGARFQGLHATRIVERTIAAAMADGTVTDREAGDIASAQVRLANMAPLQATLKVLALHEDGLTAAVLAPLLATVPEASATDDASNAQRLAVCKSIWSKHPGYYVGTDKSLTIPLGGTYYGLVEAMDPRNGAFLGGGQIDSDASFPDFDSFRIAWSWNDPDDPRRAAYPPTTSGYYYMAGTPVERVRGVINVTVANSDFSQISGEVSIFTNLGHDDVHF
jgi:hypothetical protein